MARVEDQLTELATMSLAQLQAEWQRLNEGPAPVLPARLLCMAIGYRLQEKARGGLPAAIARELGRAAAVGESPPVARVVPTSIRPDTRLVRSWQGRTIDVLATEDGRRVRESTPIESDKPHVHRCDCTRGVLYRLSFTVVGDACATRALSIDDVEVPAAHVHAAFMAALAFAYGQVVSTSDFVSA